MTMTEPLTTYQKHLVDTHIKLAQRLGLDAWRRAKEPMEKYEVVAIAYQGLIKAAQMFDPEMRPLGATDEYDPFLAFGAYAKLRINGTILDWQRQQDHVSNRHRRMYKELVTEGHGSGASPEDLASRSGYDVEKIRMVIQSVETYALSLDATAEDEWRDSPAPSAYPHQLSSEISPLVAFLQTAVADAIRDMPVLQRSILVLHYYSGVNLSAVAIELGVSPSTVRTLHREAMEQLHALMRRSAS